MRYYKNFIFDLDGTLLDTLDDLAAATNYALAQHQLPPRSKDQVRQFVGNGIRTLIARAVPAGTSEAVQEQVFASFNAYYRQHCADNTSPYPGILRLLQQLRTQGCRTAIVSNKADYAVQQLAEQYFPLLLDAACGEQQGIARKPAPDMLLAVMKKLHASPQDTVYIGDSDTDIEAARNALLPCISVCWGFRSRSFLLEHQAQLLAEKPEDILQFAK